MKKINRKVLLITIIGLALLVGIFGAYRIYNNEPPSDDSLINYEPPTEEEASAGNNIKKELSEDNNSSNQNSNEEPRQISKNSTPVLITDAGQYGDLVEVRAFMPNIYQDGTCRVRFTKGDQLVTRDAPAYADSSNTVCTNPEIKRSEFPSGGEWKVTVTYESNDAKGTSEPLSVRLN